MMDGVTVGDQHPKSRLRIAAWCLIPILLAIPLIAMRFTDEVAWDVTDFVIMGGMMVAVGLALELASRKTSASAYRIGLGLALAAGFLTTWMNGAVGIIGNESNPANMIFFAVLAVGLLGAVIARFEARGMALAMNVTAAAQVLAFVIALAAGWGFTGFITLFLLAFWLGSAQQFKKAVATGSG